MLRRRAREEDDAVLIDMASLESGNGSSYGSTTHASEVPSTQGVGASLMKVPFSPSLDSGPRGSCVLSDLGGLQSQSGPALSPLS